MLPLRLVPFAAVLTAAVASLPFVLSTGGALAWSGFSAAALLALVGLHDVTQTRHAILRNYPIIGHGRYLMEAVRPELRQYFIEDDLDGRPYNREQRSLIYQRAKGVSDYDPFGSEVDASAVGYEWIGHSVAATHGPDPADLSVRIGGPHCTRPYGMSLLNVSAMSFGSLGPSAIRALGRGAKEAGFAHNTGEGGVSDHHLESGADLVWQLGTGYFGCRAADGSFSPDLFEQRARHDHVKMIEVKLSQGAKPGHGGILPGHKVTAEIAAARGVTVGETCLSPPCHTAFEGPDGLVAFVDRLRALADGKPVGVKLCVGLPHELLALVRAMEESGSGPDYIAVDGGEGGTGAAPVEFGDHVGAPLEEGLVLVQNALVGAGIRDRVGVIAAGKVTSAMDILRLCALGADATNAARAFMMSIGCIQAQVCHTNHCPVGVATMDPGRNRGLEPVDKGQRAARFHRATMATLGELCGAAGLENPRDCEPARIRRRTAPDLVRTLAAIHHFEEPGALLRGEAHPELQAIWDAARAHSWTPDPPLVPTESADR